MTLDDIDWRSGTIWIRGSKGNRGRTLPIWTALGQAISAYLIIGAPTIGRPAPFLASYRSGRDTCYPHVGPCCLPSRVRWGNQAYPLRWHPHPATYGCHPNVPEGQCMKGIADVLGYRCIDTTAIYAKLDLKSLRTAAFSWLGGAP